MFSLSVHVKQKVWRDIHFDANYVNYRYVNQKSFKNEMKIIFNVILIKTSLI